MGLRQSRSRNGREEHMYGKSFIGAVPVHFSQYTLNPHTLNYLQDCPLFSSTENELESMGYCKAIDYPDIPEHVYYEAYMHSLPTQNTYFSMHSRNGYDFEKPAAPLRVVSFCEALRQINDDWIKGMIKQLEGMSGAAAEVYCKLLSEGRLFADLSVQLHYGAEISHERAAFHNDGPNSLLHLALSIRGQRSLLWKGSKDKDAVMSNLGRKGWFTFSESYNTYEEKQVPGSVYLSSPFLVSHGVSYPICDWEDRIVAVQCRCLLSTQELSLLRETSEEEWMSVIELVTTAIRNGTSSEQGGNMFRLPTLDEVESVYSKLCEDW